MSLDDLQLSLIRKNMSPLGRVFQQVRQSLSRAWRSGFSYGKYVIEYSVRVERMCCLVEITISYLELPKSLIKIVLSTTSMLKSDQTGGYSRFSNSSFANLFFKIEWTCAPLNFLPRTVKYPSLFNQSAMASKGIPFSRCSEMV